MPELDLNLLTVIRAFDDDDSGAAGARGAPLLVEAVLFPEVCCLDKRQARARVTLRAALTHVLHKRLPPNDLHTRAMSGTPEVREVTVELEPPPGKDVAWSGPVSLRFHAIQWRHGDEASIAFVPALGIEVAAAKPEELEKLLPEHIRFALRRTKVASSLYRLALLDRVRGVRLEPLEVRADIQDPKQRAQASEREEETKPVIETAGTVLTAPGTSLPPAFEVDGLVAQLGEALGGRSPRSVLIVGPSGVGKTAAVRQLVRTLAQFGLANTPVWSTSGSRLVAGMSGFGMWQKRVGQLVKEARKAGAVLHVGSLIELMEVGRSVMVGQGIASLLRPYIGRGDVLVIAECTPEQLAVIEREDPHLLAVFRQVVAEEPSREAGARILRRFAEASARPVQPSPTITDAALDTLDQLHRRYAGYSAYPGRPLRFLANLLRDASPETQPVIAPVDVVAAFARETGLPRFMLDEAVPLDLAVTRKWFAERVIGQVEAVDLVVDVLATVKAALNRPRRPIASLLFIGPTGVGKTEMAKTLAEFFFSDKSRVSRFDMSEYASPAAVARLVGGGTGAGEGLLTAKVREQPFSVILLDEFEKADPSLFDLMLQVLGEGRLTDAAGRVADFSNAIVIMTSNLGAESFQRGSFGLRTEGSGGPDGVSAKRFFVEAVRDFFRPELFNRIDRVVPFAPLDRATIAAVTRRELDLVARRDGVKLRGVELSVSDAAVAHLADRGFDARYGARPLKRAIERELLVPLAEALNTYPEQIRLTAIVDVEHAPGTRPAPGDTRLSVNVRAKVEPSGRQASAMPSGSAAADVARRASWLRRRAQYLERSSAVLALRNEVYRLREVEQRERRRARRSHVPFDAARAARLKRLTDVEQSLANVIARTVAIEDALLHAIYDDRADAPAVTDGVADELARLEAEKDRVPLALYALRHDDPDAITLAVYCEHPRPLLRLARAYHDVTRLLDGEVTLAWFRRVDAEKPEPPDRFRDKAKEAKKQKAEPSSSDAAAGKANDKDKPKLELVHEADPTRFLAGNHPDLIGVVLALRCPHALPRFESETGLHAIKDNAGDAMCLVERVDAPLDKYRPAAAAGTRGWIAPGVPRRTYDLKNRVLREPTGDEYPFTEVPFERALRDALQFALDETVWAALDGGA